MKPTKRDTRQFKLDMLGHNLQTLNLVVHGCFCCWLVSWSNPCYHGMLPKELMLGWYGMMGWWFTEVSYNLVVFNFESHTSHGQNHGQNHGDRKISQESMVAWDDRNGGSIKRHVLTMAQKKEHIPWIVELISNQNELFLLFTRLLSWSPGISWPNVSSSGVLQFHRFTTSRTSNGTFAFTVSPRCSGFLAVSVLVRSLRWLTKLIKKSRSTRGYGPYMLDVYIYTHIIPIIICIYIYII
jgi:hypothetical protein